MARTNTNRKFLTRTTDDAAKGQTPMQPDAIDSPTWKSNTPMKCAFVAGRQITSRFFFSLVTILLVGVGFTSPESVIYKLIEQGGPFSVVTGGVTLVAALLALSDVILNDILPEKFKFFCDRTKRHVIWCFIGICYFIYSLMAAKMHFSFGVVSMYFLFGLWASAIAAMDVVYEINERMASNAQK